MDMQNKVYKIEGWTESLVF